MEYAKLKNDDIVTELYRRFRCIHLNQNKRIVFLGVPGSGRNECGDGLSWSWSVGGKSEI